jgi:hypothetical protein
MRFSSRKQCETNSNLYLGAASGTCVATCDTNKESGVTLTEQTGAESSDAHCKYVLLKSDIIFIIPHMQLLPHTLHFLSKLP